MAPQFTATKGFMARSDAPCMARAITSLPTPLSPRISTGMVDLAARSPIRLTCCMGAESPIRSLKLNWPPARFLRRCTSAERSPICRALRIDTMMRSGEAGLIKKSWAPACMALTTTSTPPVAVSTITGWSKPRTRISLRVSMPDRPGIDRSRITTSATPPPASRFSASSPLSAWATPKPSRSSTAWIRRRWVGSSSTTRTVLAIGVTVSQIPARLLRGVSFWDGYALRGVKGRFTRSC